MKVIDNLRYTLQAFQVERRQRAERKNKRKLAITPIHKSDGQQIFLDALEKATRGEL